MKNPPIERRLFEILTSAITSCPVILEEPPIMAVARMMVVAERSIAALEDNGIADSFLSSARTAILENITSMMAEPEKFREWVEYISDTFVVEAKRRNIADFTHNDLPEAP